MIPPGLLRTQVFSVGSGAGGNISLPIRPPVGELWNVRWGRGTHDDVAGLTVYWQMNDTVLGILGILGGGTTQPFYLGTYYIGKDGPTIDYTCYLVVQVMGMAAAKAITATIVYDRIIGAPPR
jgi:hypothetical protein